MKDSKVIVSLGIDLGKNQFHLFGVNAVGKRIVKKQLSRSKSLSYLAALSPCLIGMEACGGSHYWARRIRALGHDARLMAPQFVKPYVKGNKNDFNDAEAICEAVARPNMRFVDSKSIEQQDVQAMHRIRQQDIKTRTALINQIRGLLSEYGIVISQGIRNARRNIPLILEDAENELTVRFRRWLKSLYDNLCNLDERIAGYDKEVESIARDDEACIRLQAIEGVGVLTATACVGAFGKAQAFKNGRQLSASLGLVPRQHSTGGKPTLLGISKRGDRYLRSLLIHGGRSVVRTAENKTDVRSLWIQRLVRERGKNKAAVAVANKNARIIWALLYKGESYSPAGIAA
jgi:transposase